MKLRILGFGLVLLVACSGPGCEPMSHWLRPKADDTMHDDEGDSDQHGEIKSEAPKGFFKSSRLPGAMSDEGREIEKDLGIH